MSATSRCETSPAPAKTAIAVSGSSVWTWTFSVRVVADDEHGVAQRLEGAGVAPGVELIPGDGEVRAVAEGGGVVLGMADARRRVVSQRGRRLAAQRGHDAGEDDDHAVAAGVDDARLAQHRQQLGPAAHRRLAGDDRLLEDVGQHALLLVALGVRPQPRRIVRQARRDVRGHVAHDGQHRALGRRADRRVGALRGARHRGARGAPDR